MGSHVDIKAHYIELLFIWTQYISELETITSFEACHVLFPYVSFARPKMAMSTTSNWKQCTEIKFIGIFVA